MSLRLRLILGYSALLLVLALAAWLGLRSLTGDLTTALGETAASVGRSVYTVLRSEIRQQVPGEAERDDAQDPRHVVVLRERAANTRTHEVVEDLRVVIDGKELSPEVAA